MKKIILAVFFFYLFSVVFSTASAETYTQTFTKDDRTYIVTKTIEDGIITIETKVYDSSGQLLKTNLVQKEAKPTPVKEQTYPEKASMPKPTATKTPEVSPTPSEEQEFSKPMVSSYLQSSLAMEISSETGNLIVKTGSGDKELKISPDVVVKLAEAKGMNIISEVRLDQGSEGLIYQIKGSKKEKLLAIFEVYLPTAFIFNADNANLEKVTQSSLVRLVDFFSF